MQHDWVEYILILHTITSQIKENIAVGYKLGFLVSAQLGLEYKFDTRIKLITRFDFVHSSNGHTALPNVGINIPTFGAGINYTFDNQPISNKDTFDIYVFE